jgi:saccharopine dehydrogenase-like NADP-dependent oxidoreductase
VKLVEHAHDEPILMGRNAKEFFKGARNIFFKYGGAGQQFAQPLFKMGMLSNKPVELDGNQVIPLNLVKKLLPPAPKYKEEIKEILDEGLISDTGAMVIESVGVKDGKKVMVENYVYSPGCAEAFERSGLTAEMYQTGQSGFLFTKMFLEGRYTQRGLISSDMLTFEQVDYYLEEAAKYDIRTEVTVREI